MILEVKVNLDPISNLILSFEQFQYSKMNDYSYHVPQILEWSYKIKESLLSSCSSNKN